MYIFVFIGMYISYVNNAQLICQTTALFIPRAAIKYPLYGLEGFPKHCQNNSWPTRDSSLDFVLNSKTRVFFMTLCSLFLECITTKVIFVYKQVSLVPNANHLITF